MIPVRIRLSGFMSYKDEVEIDFAKVLQTKVFLIQGPTGAGKSSIMDAIIFSLYGKTPRFEGDRRKSNFINYQSDKAIVEFEFKIKDVSQRYKRYIIKRILDRFDTQQVEVKSKYDDEEESSWRTTVGKNIKVEEINKKIEENIIGLSYDVFTKTVVLPQGRFAELLHAKPKERSDILLQIYGFSELFQKIKEKSSEELKILKAEKEKIELELKELEDTTPQKLEELKKETKRIENEIYEKEKERKQLEGKIEFISGELEKIKSLQNKAEKIREICSEIAEEIKSQLEKIEALKRISDKEEKIKNSLQLLNEIYDEIEKQSQNFKIEPDVLLKTRIFIDDLKEKIEKLEKEEKEILKLQTELEKITLKEKALKDKLANQDEDIIQILKELSFSLEISKQEEINIKESLEKKKKELEEINNIKQKSYEIINILQKEEFNLRGKLQNIENEIKKIENDIEKLKEKVLAERIRQNLKDGDFCPVCGNIFKQHNTPDIIPHKKILEEISFKEKIKREKEDEKNNIQHEIEKIRNKIGKEEGKISELETRIKKLESEIENSEKNQSEIHNRIQENISRLYELSEKIKNEDILSKSNDLSDPLLSDDEFLKITKEIKISSDQKIKEIRKLKEELSSISQEKSNIIGLLSKTKKEKELLQKQVFDRKQKMNEYINSLSLIYQNILTSAEITEEIKSRVNEIKEKWISKQKEKNNQAFQDIEEKTGKIIEEIDRIKSHFSSCARKINEFIEGSTRFESKENAISNLKEISNLLRKEILEDAEKDLKEAISRFDNFIKKLLNSISKYQSDIGNIISEKSKIQEDIKSSESKILGNINLIREKISDIESESEFKLNQNLDLIDIHNFPELGTIIRNLESEIKDKILPAIERDLKKISDEKVKLQTLKDSISDELNALQRTYGILQEKAQTIQENLQKKEKLKSQIPIIDENIRILGLILEDFGDKEPSFKKYLSSKLLERILEAASDIMRTLSQSRYAFSIGEEGDMRIKILDYSYLKDGKPQVRETYSMSGGETFIASLSLALALSSQIIGHRKFECFFIDEGFGSLDEDSLDLVMQTLENFAKTGIYLGIITHVESMKSQIQFSKIIVKKDGATSKIEI
jgi:DNA repair exonuclease SbcCD ATPase subunit